MIVETTLNGRPVSVMYMTDDFEPVDEEFLATLLKVNFLDEEGGSMFLVPKSHTDVGGDFGTDFATQVKQSSAYRMRARRRLLGLREKFDPDQPRDESGRWTSGGGGGAGGTEKPSAPPATPSERRNVSEAAANKYLQAIDSAPTNEGIEAAEENWAGGVADFGDPQAAIDIQNMDGYFEYRSHLEEAAREHLGEEFNVYRLMRPNQLEEWQNGADMSPMATSWSQETAEKFAGFAGFRPDQNHVVVRIPATPASIVMRGRPEEREIVINPNELSADTVEIVSRQRPKWLIDLLQKFDPDQPRDEQGRWTSGGGGAAGAADKPLAPPARTHPGKGYSKDAYVDSKGVIHTNNVYDAQLALFEDKKVNLDQPRTLSTLIDKLGATAKDMIAKGEQAPTFNLCNVTVTGSNLFCADTKGVPRIEMPQIKTSDQGKFVQSLIDKGYKSEQTTELASHVRATQNQLDGASVAGIANRIREQGYSRNIIVGRDNYLLDGHHYWAARVGVDAASGNLNEGTRMSVTRIDIPIIDLLREAHEFTGGAGRVGLGERHRRFPKWFIDLELRFIKRTDQCLKWLRVLDLLKFDPDQPRDEQGRWTSGGGGGATGAADKPFAPSRFSSPATLDDFAKADIEINTRFESTFIDRWNSKIGMPPSEFREKFMGGTEGTMNIEFDKVDRIRGEPKEFIDAYGYIHDGGTKIGRYSTRFDLDENTAEAQSLVYDNAEQGKGRAKPFIASQVALCQELGLGRLELTASYEVGAYAWAKYGFVPTHESWDELRTSLDYVARRDPTISKVPVIRKLTGSSDPKAIWGIADSKFGKDLLLGRTWEGALTFSDNRAMRRFNAYVGKPTAATKAFDPDQPRDEQGRWTSGGGGGSTGGAADKPFVPPAAKPATAADFAKADVKIPRHTEEVVRIWNERVGIPPEKVRDAFLGGMNGTMEISKPYADSASLSVVSDLQDASGNKIGHYASNMDFDDNIAGLNTLRFDRAEQGKGHAKQILAATVDTFQKAGMEKASLYATDVGAYAWAKYGFVPTNTAWSKLQNRLQTNVDRLYPGRSVGVAGGSATAATQEFNAVTKLIQSSNPKAIWPISDSPRGKALLKGTGWGGNLDFSDADSMRRFNAFVSKPRASAKIFAELLEKFDPDQPRDESGRWTSGGGSGAGADKPVSPSSGVELIRSAQARQNFVNDVAKQYGLPPQELRMDETTKGHALAHASTSYGIALNPDYWNSPEKMAEYEKEWDGLILDATPEGVLLHEMGHRALQQVKMPPGLSEKAQREWTAQKDAIVKKYWDSGSHVSAYAGESPSEALAEAFVSMHRGGKTTWPEWSDQFKGSGDAAKAVWRELYEHAGKKLP